MTDTEVPTHVENESASPHAVFVDIDGTLCDSRQRIPGSALEALAQVRNRGHLLFACTGRSAPEVYTRFWDVGFEGLVGGAGGYASVGDRVLVDERMPREHVGMLTALWQELDAFYIWQGPDQMGPSEGYLDFFVPRAGKHPEDWIEYAQSITPFITDINSGAFTKVTAYVPPEKASMERVTAALPDGYRAIIGSVGAAGYVPFEVVPAHLSKAVGIRAICEHVGIPLSHTVALGDSNNDVEAVATAAVGISIGDDCEALVDVADIVAPSVSEDGLAWALRATGLTSDDPSGGQGLGDAR
ncbi:MAG: HAD hydrolase family protein [Schaalia odontolytica]|uniref:HAD hydrolase family protein n=2 Tax=Schaalia odontolytica TaxID=1660 RepID=A0A857A9K8_9ACTO|nr:HAD hydrolase family protein [Schaalia odontolytica]EFF80158.1 Cof-like hydrolase [Schaalia odontolytica F0309]MDU5761380.1 HAD hydrolase family protein [Schaalia odontolytica]QGS11176.1 HAD hydrolase family protein [Schaalia odontolytica]